MVTSTYAPVQQSGNGVITAFNFSFKILAASDLVVYKIDASSVQSSPLTLGTDYTVTFDPIAETGTVSYTVAPVSGGFSLITRDSNNQQQSSLPREGPMQAKTVETMIDKATMLIQELEVGIGPGITLALEVAAAQAAATSAAASAAAAIAALSGAGFLKTGIFATLDSSAGSSWFIAQVTDLRLIMAYLGNRALGTNGWITMAGY